MNAFYAVHTGKNRGVYSTWEETKAQVCGVKGSVYRKFSTREEADRFVVLGKLWQSHVTTLQPLVFHNHKTGERVSPIYIVDTDELPAGDLNQLTLLHDPRATPAGFFDVPRMNQDDGIALPISGNNKNKNEKITGSSNVIYTDGSCLDNGQPGARAGWGVWIGENDPKNASGCVPGAQTNQRAEVCALTSAYDIADSEYEAGNRCKILVLTDSKYARDMSSKWIAMWRRRNWVTVSTGKKPENYDLAIKLAESMDRCRSVVEVRYVEAHTGIRGNEEADRLAKSAAAASKRTGKIDDNNGSTRSVTKKDVVDPYKPSNCTQQPNKKRAKFG